MCICYQAMMLTNQSRRATNKQQNYESPSQRWRCGGRLSKENVHDYNIASQAIRGKRIGVRRDVNRHVDELLNPGLQNPLDNLCGHGLGRSSRLTDPGLSSWPDRQMLLVILLPQHHPPRVCNPAIDGGSTYRRVRHNVHRASSARRGPLPL